jgi:hypothetical protein
MISEKPMMKSSEAMMTWRFALLLLMETAEMNER